MTVQLAPGSKLGKDEIPDGVLSDSTWPSQEDPAPLVSEQLQIQKLGDNADADG